VRWDLESMCVARMSPWRCRILADQVSTKVIKGVSYTSLEGAKALVAAGAAKQSDFWVCVGYSGWAPGQLQAPFRNPVGPTHAPFRNPVVDLIYARAIPQCRG
jgi:hypothetical protein